MALLLVLGFVLLPLVLLCIPLHVHGSVDTVADNSSSLHLTWAWGFLRLHVRKTDQIYDSRFSVCGLRLASPHMTRSEHTKPETTTKRRQGSLSDFVGLLKHDILVRLKTLILRVLRSLRIRADVSGTYSTGDPAATGAIAGLLAVLGLWRVGIRIRPDFGDAALRVRGWLSARIVPIAILCHVLRFMLERPVRAIWLPKLLARKSKKREVLRSESV